MLSVKNEANAPTANKLFTKTKKKPNYVTDAKFDLVMQIPINGQCPSPLVMQP